MCQPSPCSLQSVIDYTQVTSIIETNTALTPDYSSTGKPSAESSKRTVETSALRANICLTPHTASNMSLLCLLSQCGAGIDSLCPPLPLPFCFSSFYTSFLFLLRSDRLPPAGLWPDAHCDMSLTDAESRSQKKYKSSIVPRLPEVLYFKPYFYQCLNSSQPGLHLFIL